MEQEILGIDINLEKMYENIKKEKQYTIPIFIPHMGCRHDCVFCNQRRISGSIKVPTSKDIQEQIDERLRDFKDTSVKIQIAFFGGSFTGISKKLQEEYLSTAYKYIEDKKVESIRISTRPDYISPSILMFLKKYGVKNIELGVQSMDQDVLDISKRGHTTIDVMTAAKQIKAYGFKLGFQVMVGLPESSLEKEVNTIRRLNSYNPDEYRVYPVYVIENTELYDMYKKGSYEPLELEDAVNRSFHVVNEIFKKNAKIIRLGLQSTDEVSILNDRIYGPVSDNFAEYVYANIIYENIEKVLKQKKIERNIHEEHTKLNINVDKKIPLSWIVGPKKINIARFKKEYNFEINIIRK